MDTLAVEAAPATKPRFRRRVPAHHPIDVEIGRRVHLLRRVHGLTLKELGLMVHLSGPTVSYVERGETALRPEAIVAFAAALGVTPNYFFVAAGTNPDHIATLDASAGDDYALGVEIAALILRMPARGRRAFISFARATASQYAFETSSQGEAA